MCHYILMCNSYHGRKLLNKWWLAGRRISGVAIEMGADIEAARIYGTYDTAEADRDFLNGNERLDEKGYRFTVSPLHLLGRYAKFNRRLSRCNG